MKLSDVFLRADALKDDDVIFARRPWGGESEIVIGSLTSDFKVPLEMEKNGFDYFLEWHVAKEVLDVIADQQASQPMRLELLLYYAENDAYPDWVFRDR